jgi:hypothetical protein
MITQARIPQWYAEEGASISIKGVQATAYSVRFAALRSGFRQQLKAGIDMICIANDCAKST